MEFGGEYCGKDWANEYCDFRTGKRYGCHDVDECQPNPCVHGTCRDGVNNCTCQCTPGYKGDKCDKEVNACDLWSWWVEVGSSKKFGCYGYWERGEYKRKCWRKTHSNSNIDHNDYHKWCNVPNEKCTKSLYKSAKCASKHNHTMEFG